MHVCPRSGIFPRNHAGSPQQCPTGDPGRENSHTVRFSFHPQGIVYVTIETRDDPIQKPHAALTYMPSVVFTRNSLGNFTQHVDYKDPQNWNQEKEARFPHNSHLVNEVAPVFYSYTKTKDENQAGSNQEERGKTPTEACR
jgi:hypothetical protein